MFDNPNHGPLVWTPSLDPNTYISYSNWGLIEQKRPNQACYLLVFVAKPVGRFMRNAMHLNFKRERLLLLGSRHFNVHLRLLCCVLWLSRRLLIIAISSSTNQHVSCKDGGGCHVYWGLLLQMRHVPSGSTTVLREGRLLNESRRLNIVCGMCRLFLCGSSSVEGQRSLHRLQKGLERCCSLALQRAHCVPPLIPIDCARGRDIATAAAWKLCLFKHLWHDQVR